MKKIALCSLLVCLGMMNAAHSGTVTESCYATKRCGAHDNVMWSVGGGVAGFAGGSVIGTAILPGFGSWAGAIGGAYYGSKLGGKIGKNYTANEYIYFEDGSCLECDTHQIGEDFECPNGSVVTNGDKAFVCKAQFTGDLWEEYTIPVCSDSPVKPSNVAQFNKYKTILKDNITNNGKPIKDGVLVFSGAVCWYITGELKDSDQCTFSDGSKHKLGDKVEFDCSKSPDGDAFKQNARTGKTCWQSCLKRLSDNKLTNYWSVKTCPDNKDYVGFDTADYQKYTPDIPGYKRCGGSNELPEVVVTPEKKACKDSRSTAEGKACCDLPASEAKWENNQCKCLNGKEFKIVNGRGQCVAKQGGNELPEDGECEYSFNVTIECANGSNYSGYHTVKLTKEDLRGETCTTFQQRFENDMAVIQKYKDMLCGKYIGFRLPDQNGPSAGELQKAQDTMTQFVNGAKGEASVWKDSEGKFNTARLASDLTAGVVLGTVGGVVSGVVIKKKQVEKGFDALHCTVGGQKIADWGDEFSVGLQR